ncbi:MAG: RNA polymerase sigma factor RpoE [Thiohalorhabdus sp.]|uniref:RNA polymerase sigma factor RpoE n=1 Tax=Thiohalorhabdus sp. TaxID=3094134 RepID=UPI003980CB81
MGDRQTDQQLVERVKNGEQKAFDLLVRKYQHKVYGLVSRFISDPAAVEDVVQESFIKAYRSLDRFRGDSAFYTWLYRIAVNTAKNYLVAKGRRPPDADIDASDAEQMSGAEVMREVGTPEDVALSKEMSEKVLQVIEELPSDLRTALTLREIDGLTYEEIAKVMDCPIGTVRSRIFRAREAVNNALEALSREKEEQ